MKNNFLLVEFKSNDCLKNLLDNHVNFSLNYDNLIPSTLRIINYTTENKDNDLNNNLYINCTNTETDIASILLKVSKLKDLSSQIQLFYDLSKINDSSQRIRYFIASLIENGFSQLFKNCICLPFGSSVNNFGSFNSDLDLSFSFDGSPDIYPSMKDSKSPKIEGGFFYLNRTHKLFRQNLFGIFEQYFDLIYPRFRTTELVPFAKIPIIKFEFDYGEKMKCDLSMSNYKSTFLMSKLFWSLSQTDPKVAPLVFTIRQWALINGIRNTRVPNDSISNFHLTNLVLYYLKTILFNSIDNLIEFNTKDLYQTDLTNETHLAKTIILDDYEMLKIQNSKSLCELLLGFFEFYSDFNFDSNIISFTSKPYAKIREKNLFIENAFFPNVNASANVSKNKVNHFRESCRIAAEILRHDVDLFKFMDKVILNKVNCNNEFIYK